MVISSKTQPVLPGLSGWLVLALITIFPATVIARHTQENPRTVSYGVRMNLSWSDSENSREWLMSWYGTVCDIAFNIIYIIRTKV